MTRRSRLAARPGFTLLELALVLAIMVIMTAMAVPIYDRLYGNVPVDAAADQLRGAWAEAKAQAIEEGRPYRFAVKPETGEFRVAPDRRDYWDGTAPPEDDPELPYGSRAMVVEESLPKQIVFSPDLSGGGGPGDDDAVAGNSQGWSPVATFLPDGTFRADFTVRLRREGERTVELQGRALTGVITFRRYNEGQS